MKTILFLSSMLLFAFTNSVDLSLQKSVEISSVDITLLIGNWKLDLSPLDDSDNNFAKMNITSVGENSLEGTFYRDGVKIREGRINKQNDVIHAALVSGDNSGIYNTSFYYKDGLLYGTTHSVDKDFLAVWTATKVNK